MANVDVARAAIMANRSGPAEETIDVVVALADPQLEFTSRVAAVEGAAYIGPDGLRRYFADMAEAWREWRNEPHEIVELSGGAVVAHLTFHGIGKDSAVPVELKNAVAFVIEGDRIVRCVAAATREDALDGAVRRKP
jgi:hypothetical protein